MENALRQWIFGDKSPSKAHASIGTPLKSASGPGSQPIPTDTAALSVNSVASSVSNMSIGSPRELVYNVALAVGY